MFLKRLSAVLLIAGFAAAAHATQVQVKEGAKAAAEAKPDDIICTYERTTGSHVPRRVCATKRQRDEERQRAQEGADRMHSPSQNSGMATGD